MVQCGTVLKVCCPRQPKALLREHLRKVRQGIVAVVETIAPEQEDETWAELTRSGILDAQCNARKMGDLECR